MNDFADWLSPILVKELRQGMRTKVFITTFIAIQLFMIIGVLVSLSSPDDSGASSGLFWTVLGIGILFAMPVRGLGALGGEIKGNTLELMLLTQLSAWRITAGKWLALVLQSMLIVCAVLPYMVLRYFLGGVDIAEDLQSIGVMLASSVFLTAFFVGVSPFVQTVIGRVLLGFALVLAFQIIPIFFFARRFSGGGGTSLDTSTLLMAAAILGPLVILEFFEFGVGKIAPGAENHAAHRRLIAGLIMISAAIIGGISHEKSFMMGLAVAAITPICLGALSEETVAIPSVYRPFLRWKLLGRVAGIFLCPGWASGLCFTFLVGGIYLLSAPLAWGNHDVCFRTISAAEAVLAPLAVVRLGFRRAKNIFPYYLGLQLLLFVTAVFVSVGDNEAVLLRRAAPVPTIGFFTTLWGRHRAIELPYALSLVITVVSILGLLLLSLKEWRIITEAARKAKEVE